MDRRLAFALVVVTVGAVANPAAQSPAGELHDAVTKNDRAAVARLLDAGARIETTSGEVKWTPLHRAASNGHQHIVALLLERKAKVGVKDENGDTPLHLAARRGHRAVVVALLDARADVRVRNRARKAPLDLAIAGDDLAVAKLLIERGASVEDPWALTTVAVKAGDVELTRSMLVQGVDPRGGTNRYVLATTMIAAVAGGHPELLTILLDAGGQADWALPSAVKKGDPALVTLLLNRGGKPALMLPNAIGACNRGLVQAALERGAAANDEGLMSAVKSCDASLVTLLLDKGASANTRSAGAVLKIGSTPEGYAAIETKHPLGWTVLGRAVARGDEGLVALLLARGAERDAQFIASPSDETLAAVFWEAFAETLGPSLILSGTLAASDKAIRVYWRKQDSYIEKRGDTITAAVKGGTLPEWMRQNAAASEPTTAVVLAERLGHASIVQLLKN